jgi:hypothetical protein
MKKARWFVLLAVAVPLVSDGPSWAGEANKKSPKSILEKIDETYAGIPPVKYEPAADRWTYLPKTIERLRQGPELRVVMLGDSIVNDTSRSAWEKLVERAYPKCRIAKVTSVRGSTGCWWYKEEGRVKEWVLQHKPDLLMIGGISNRDDVESIRAVIRQVRAADSPPEILVMTGCFGSTNPRDDKQWTFQVDPNGKDYRARLLRMAADEKVEFLDMMGPWGKYVRQSGQELEWFKRDPVHANSRGEAILGRILLQYFSPKEKQVEK